MLKCFVLILFGRTRDRVKGRERWEGRGMREREKGEKKIFPSLVHASNGCKGWDGPE